MISSHYRFHGHNSLRYVYSNGKSVRSQQITIKYVINKRRALPRFSVVISKKVIKSAVGRNRVRRRVYEYLRLHTPDFNDVFDIVVICTSGELRAMPASQLYELLDDLFRRADLYKSVKN